MLLCTHLSFFYENYMVFIFQLPNVWWLTYTQTCITVWFTNILNSLKTNTFVRLRHFFAVNQSHIIWRMHSEKILKKIFLKSPFLLNDSRKRLLASTPLLYIWEITINGFQVFWKRQATGTSSPITTTLQISLNVDDPSDQN